MITGIMDNGLVYQVLTDNNTLEVLGALEILKSYAMIDMIAGE